jgi:hypothetical protein
MARGKATFRLSDLTRAVKGARAAGLDVRLIRIEPNGAIVLDTAPGVASDEALDASTVAAGRIKAMRGT